MSETTSQITRPTLDPEFERRLDEHERKMNEKQGRESSLFGFDDAGMTRMKELIEVSEEMNLKRIGRDVDLYSSDDRKLLGAVEGDFRIKSLDSPLRKCKVYIFNDLLIVAKYQKYTGKKALLKAQESGDSSSGAIEFAEVVGQRRHSDSSDEDYGEDDSETEEGDRKSKKKMPKVEKMEYIRLEMRMWLDLSKVRVRLVEDKKSGGHGVSLTYVFRQKKKEEGKIVWENKVKNTEFWCKDEKSAEQLIDPIIEAKDELTKKEIKKREESKIAYEKARAEGKRTGKRVPRRRKYVDSITKMKKIQAARQRYAGSLGKTKSLVDDDVIKLSLQELQQKYHLDVKKEDETKEETPEEVEQKKKDKEVVIFSNTFEKGPLGMQVSSHEAVGVFVAKVATNGMADAGGIGAGDRLVEINGEFIPRKKHWKECLKLLSARPLTIKFTRTNLQDEAYVQEKEEREQAEKEAIEEEMKEREKKRKARPNTARKWKQAHTESKQHGGKIETVHDLERIYKEGKLRMQMIPVIAKMFQALIDKSKNESEKQTLYTLREIYTTERKYVDQVSTLLWEFKQPLEEATYYPLCRELPEVNFCEHEIKAADCEEKCSVATPVMSRSDVNRIFMNIGNMIVINKKLLDNLEKGLSKIAETMKMDTICVSHLVKVYRDVFIPIAPYFKMYGTYAIHYVGALNYLTQLERSNEEFRSIMNKLNKKQEEKSKGQHMRMDLRTLLGVPSQRITKYQLLFLNLAKAATPYMRYEADFAMAKSHDGSIEFASLMKIHGNAETPSVERRKTLALINVDKMADHLMELHTKYFETAAGVQDYVKNQNRLDDLIRIHAELGGAEIVPGLLKGSRRYLETVTCWVKFDNEKKHTALTVYIFKDLVVGASPIPTTWKKLLPRSTFVHGRDSVRPSKGTMQKQNSGGSEPTRKPSSTTATGAQGGNGTKKTKKTAKTTGTLKPTMRPRLWIDLLRANQVADVTRREEGRFGFTVYLPVRVAPGDTYRKKKNKSDSLDTKLEIYGFWFESEGERDRVSKVVENSMKQSRKEAKEKKDAQRKAGLLGRQRRWKRGGTLNGGTSHQLSRIQKLEKLVEQKKAAEEAEKARENGEA